jgi:hypothetical protein
MKALLIGLGMFATALGSIILLWFGITKFPIISIVLTILFSSWMCGKMFLVCIWNAPKTE